MHAYDARTSTHYPRIYHPWSNDTRYRSPCATGFHLASQSILGAHSKVLSSLRPLTASLARMCADIKKVVAFMADKFGVIPNLCYPIRLASRRRLHSTCRAVTASTETMHLQTRLCRFNYHRSPGKDRRTEASVGDSERQTPAHFAPYCWHQRDGNCFLSSPSPLQSRISCLYAVYPSCISEDKLFLSTLK